MADKKMSITNSINQTFFSFVSLFNKDKIIKINNYSNVLLGL